jgi:calmodulin
MADQFFKRHTMDELQIAFGRFDQDGSGYIQANELERIFQVMGRRFNTEQIETIIGSCDSSGDGRINFNEFIQLFQ